MTHTPPPKKEGRPPFPPETPKRIDRVSFRLEPELAKRLEGYERDVANPRSETMNLALKLFLDVSDLDEFSEADVYRIIKENKRSKAE